MLDLMDFRVLKYNYIVDNSSILHHIYVQNSIILKVRIKYKAVKKMLVVKKTNLHYGDITFSVSAAKLWNSIPLNLKCAQIVDI